MGLLELNNLKTRFETEDGVVKAVDGVDLQVRRGETLGLAVVKHISDRVAVTYLEKGTEEHLLAVSTNPLSECRSRRRLCFCPRMSKT